MHKGKKINNLNKEGLSMQLKYDKNNKRNSN